MLKLMSLDLILPSTFTDKWRSRFGFDYKFHQLNYYEVENPWDDASAFRQRPLSNGMTMC